MKEFTKREVKLTFNAWKYINNLKEKVFGKKYGVFPLACYKEMSLNEKRVLDLIIDAEKKIQLANELIIDISRIR